MKLSNIAGTVETIMSSIPTNMIVQDEIVVHICSPSMMNLEFIDLPGIVAAPAEKQQQTEGLVNKYLQNKDTLVICVEEATCGNLDGGQALGLVLRAQKSKHTIVALTKCDNLASTEIKKRLLLRVLRSSGEITDAKQKDTDFAGCVAVINRSHHDVKTLLEAGDEEQLTFETQVFAKDPAMPQLFSAQAPAVQASLSIASLIAQVEAMYRRFVLKDWKFKALQRLRLIMANEDRQMKSLGPHPNQLAVKDVMQAVWAQLNFFTIADDMTQLGLPRIKPDHCLITVCPEPGLAWMKYGLSEGCSWPMLLRELATAIAWEPCNSFANAGQMKQVTGWVVAGVNSWLENGDYLRPLHQAIAAAFKANTCMQLSRFDSLQQEILMNGLNRASQIQQARDSIMADMQRLFTVHLTAAECWVDTDAHKDLLTKIERNVYIRICQDVLHPLKDGKFISCVPDSFQLVENADAQRVRSHLQDCRANLQHAWDVINDIELQADAPSAGAPTNACK